MFDTHMHTEFSTDSVMKIEDAVKRAKEIGLGIIITEHMDINFPRKGEFIFNVDEYLSKFSNYRNSKVLLGIELGMRMDAIKENEEIEKNHNFDYVIGSIHFVNKVDIFDQKMYENKDKRLVYEEYFKNMIDCLKCHKYIDTLAHIDYICRYATFADKEIYYNDFRNSIDGILKYIISNDICLEINTRRLNNKNTFKSLISIYKRYSELNGHYVTIGSDAHKTESIGSNFDAATEILEQCNLKAVYFKDRKPEYV